MPGTVGATRDIQVKAGGGKTRRLTGWRPGKSVHGVTHRTPGKQSGRLRGGYSRKASQKRRPASWALQGECRAAGWGASGPGGERQRCPRQNEESEHGLEAGGSGALRGAAGRFGALRGAAGASHGPLWLTRLVTVLGSVSSTGPCAPPRQEMRFVCPCVGGVGPQTRTEHTLAHPQSSGCSVNMSQSPRRPWLSSPHPDLIRGEGRAV